MVEGVHGDLYALGQNRADHRCHRPVQPLPSGISTRATGGRDLYGNTPGAVTLRLCHNCVPLLVVDANPNGPPQP